MVEVVIVVVVGVMVGVTVMFNNVKIDVSGKEYFLKNKYFL